MAQNRSKPRSRSISKVTSGQAPNEDMVVQSQQESNFLQRNIRAISIAAAVALAGVIYASNSTNESQDHQNSINDEVPIIVPNGPYGTKTFGTKGPIIYILGWDHDGGPKLEKSKNQLMAIMKGAKEADVHMVIEGFYPPGDEVELSSKINRGVRSLLYDAKRTGARIWAGEDKELLFNAVRMANLKNRKALDKNASREELCLLWYSFEMANINRTSALLKASLERKRAANDSMVIGCMGDGHFEVHEQKMLLEFAESNGVRLVLYATKDTLHKNPPPTWPEKACGSWEDVQRESRK